MREVLHAIRDWAVREPERIAITDAAGAMTYGELSSAIAEACAALHAAPPVVGVLMPRDRNYVVADLALAALGRTIVPLPDFFSPAQWRHMVADAEIGAVVTVADGRERLREVAVDVLIPQRTGTAVWSVAEKSHRVIYTSGTTGTPKGVVLNEETMTASLAGLKAAVAADANDVHLSVLPFSLLLEQLAGILLPLWVGARIHIAAAPLTAPVDAERVGATTSVLVPELLAGWVGWLRQSGRRAPASLRFVAVGGAPVGEALAQAAWDHGLPVYEGYGLSECCSVVAVNRPGQRRPGTVGKPLDGVNVAIEAGEIVVRGSTVMSGYLGRSPAGGVWHTGDAGELLPDGTLVVLGRRDDVVITPQGRNIHPEWIEPMMLADPEIRACALVAGKTGARAVLVPAPQAAEHSAAQWLARVRELTEAAPVYARPSEVALLSPIQAQSNALFTVDGRPRRRRIFQFLQEVEMSFYETLVAETAVERQVFMSIPLIRKAVEEGVDTTLYLAFLHSAYHHVRYTVPLLQAALAACGPDDGILAEGLREYVAEEIGHDEWILDDIDALGGDAEATRRARPPLPVRTMVALAFHLIAEEGPYALLGMVHVLEGMSVALAIKAAGAIAARVGAANEAGFSYLRSHGGLDVGHVDTFAKLLEAIDTPDRRKTVIAAAKDFYVLYGNVFRALDVQGRAVSHAA